MGRKKIRKPKIGTRTAAWKFLLKHDYDIVVADDMDENRLREEYMKTHVLDGNALNSLMEVFRKNDDFIVISRLIRMGVKPKDTDSLLKWVVENEHFELVEKLLGNPHVDPEVVLRHMCSAGKLEIVDFLLKHPRVNVSSILPFARVALKKGHYDVVERLLNTE